jgi:ferric uptake regulator, fur family
LICETCGRVVDVDLDFSPDLLGQVRAQTSLTVTGCRLELRGLCPGCAGKPPER